MRSMFLISTSWHIKFAKFKALSLGTASLRYPNIRTIITHFEKIQTAGYNGSSTIHIDANVLLSQKELFRKYFDGSGFASNSAKIQEAIALKPPDSLVPPALLFFFLILFLDIGFINDWFIVFNIFCNYQVSFCFVFNNIPKKKNNIILLVQRGLGQQSFEVQLLLQIELQKNYFLI